MVKKPTEAVSADNIDWRAVGAAWDVLKKQLGPISLAQTTANFVRMQQLMDDLVCVTEAPDAPSSLVSLLDCVSDWVACYESLHVPMPAADPVAVLKHLMASNELKQKDLADTLGGQSVVSAIL